MAQNYELKLKKNRIQHRHRFYRSASKLYCYCCCCSFFYCCCYYCCLDKTVKLPKETTKLFEENSLFIFVALQLFFLKKVLRWWKWTLIWLVNRALILALAIERVKKILRLLVRWKWYLRDLMSWNYWLIMRGISNQRISNDIRIDWG